MYDVPGGQGRKAMFKTEYRSQKDRGSVIATGYSSIVDSNNAPLSGLTVTQYAKTGGIKEEWHGQARNNTHLVLVSSGVRYFICYRKNKTLVGEFDKIHNQGRYQ